VVESADLRQRNDLPMRGWLDGPRLRRVFGERQVRQDSDRTAGAEQCSCDGARVLAGAAVRLEQPPRRDGFTDVSG